MCTIVVQEYPFKNYNITYQWWCNKCQTWHDDPSCPQDMIFIPTDMRALDDGTADDRTYVEICPHCGQKIIR